MNFVFFCLHKLKVVNLTWTFQCFDCPKIYIFKLLFVADDKYDFISINISLIGSLMVIHGESSERQIHFNCTNSKVLHSSCCSPPEVNVKKKKEKQRGSISCSRQASKVTTRGKTLQDSPSAGRNTPISAGSQFPGPLRKETISLPFALLLPHLLCLIPHKH